MGKKRGHYYGAKDDRRVLIRRDGSVCHYCPTNMTLSKRDAIPEPHTMTIEHVVPASKGGPDSMDNLVLACYSCNNKAGNEVFKCDCNFCIRARNKYLEVAIPLDLL